MAIVRRIGAVYHRDGTQEDDRWPTLTLEQRVHDLEKAVRELQDALKDRKPSSDWLDRVIGSMKDEPAFDEVLAYGPAIRNADRPGEDHGP